MKKLYSDSASRNAPYISEVLSEYLPEKGKVLETNLQPAHPGEEGVSGGGASGADCQDCAVLLLVHRRQAGNSSTRGSLAVHPPKYDSQSSRAKQSTKGTKKRKSNFKKATFVV